MELWGELDILQFEKEDRKMNKEPQNVQKVEMVRTLEKNIRVELEMKY
jgi:hypothetical protein